MRDDSGYEYVGDDDDVNAVLVEDETDALTSTPRRVVFEIAFDDPGPATDLARAATALGYAVEMRSPDDGEGFYEVECSQDMAATSADVVRAQRELEALAEELGGVADDDEREDREP